MQSFKEFLNEKTDWAERLKRLKKRRGDPPNIDYLEKYRPMDGNPINPNHQINDSGISGPNGVSNNRYYQ